MTTTPAESLTVEAYAAILYEAFREQIGIQGTSELSLCNLSDGRRAMRIVWVPCLGANEDRSCYAEGPLTFARRFGTSEPLTPEKAQKEGKQAAEAILKRIGQEKTP